MRSLIAALRTLVLPWGATSGRRIVLDGVNGRIEVYDLAGLLRIRLGVADAVELSSGDAAELFLADIQASVVGAGGTRQLSVITESPSFPAPANHRASIELLSDSADGSVEPLIKLRGGSVDVLPASIGGGTDLTVDGDSVPRGIIAQQRETTNDGPHTADAATDFALNNVPVIAGHTYAVHLQGLAELSAAIGAWQLNLLVNGSYHDTLSRVTNETATQARHPVNGTVLWTAPATQATDDFTVQADERTGTADLTLIGGASATSPPRTFWITHLGT